jgi:H+-translocating NAD(P) transhydrogenase subunit alpha
MQTGDTAATAQRIGVPKEVFPGEKRVATVPDAVTKLVKLGFTVVVEQGAGDLADLSDAAYVEAGATIAPNAAALWSGSDIVFKVRAPTADEVALMHEGQTLIGFLWPAQNPDLMQQLAAKKVTALSIDALPRTLSRAQKMDALTSMAGVSGYRAVVESANAFGRFFNGQITAAGKVPPAKVFIAGAGVAGLAAIGAAASLGAIVRANDTRAEVADQVVSLGGEFVKVDYEEEGSGGGGYAKVMSEGFQAAQREMYAKQAKECDIIITTALIPGKPAPKLITAEMVQSMKPGSVIVDMAAEQGGNCELTEPGKAVVKHGVTIVGYTDLASRMARQSSTLYGTNLFRLTEELCKTKDGVINVNMEDDAIRGLTVIKNGEITWPAPPLAAGAQARRQARSRACRQKRPRPWRALRPHAGGPVAHRFSGRCSAAGAGGCLRASRFPVAFHGVCVGLLCGLHGGLERQARAAHPAHERDQRDQLHHRHRRAGADIASGRSRATQHADRHLGLFGAGADGHQHVWRLCRHPAHAGDVPKVKNFGDRSLALSPTD